MSFFPSRFFPTRVLKAQQAEEEDLVDPQAVLREKCGADKCKAMREKLETCNARVLSRSQTTENCAEELYDLMHCVDHCVAKDLFKQLK